MSLTQLFLRQVDAQSLPANPYPPPTLWSFIWHFMRQTKGWLTVLLFLTFLSSACNMLGPYFLRHIVDILMETPDRAAAWQSLQIPIALYIATALILSYAFYLAMSFVRATIFSSGVGHNIRYQLHWYLLNHSWTYFQNDFAGRLANKIMDCGTEIRNLLNAGRRMAWVMVSFITAAVTLAIAEPILVIPLLIWGILFIGMIGLAVPHVRKLATIFSDTRSTCVGRMVDSYTNIQTVKLFGGQSRENHDAADIFQDARLKHADVTLAQFRIDIAQLTLEALLLSSLLISSIWLWHNGQTSAGTVAMVLPLGLMLVSQAGMLREEFGAALESIGTLEDAIGTLVKPLSVQDTPSAKTLKVEEGSITFEDVSFAYHQGQPPIIADMNLTIPAGQKVGLVGPSGAGKSTLVNLLLRFYDVTEGKIRIDGHNIAKVTQDSLRAHIGMVTQDTSLLHRSIAENIGYGKPDATMGDIIAAAKKAHAHEFIKGLVDKDGNTGYEARVGERGVKLSGGQRQRIAIARLILKDAPILILDEATSALDSEVEQAIQENLHTLMQGKTVIAIAHRLSTIAKLDRLIVLENGRIAEDGTHKDLLKKKGLYARLWSHQSGGFIAEDEDTTS